MKVSNSPAAVSSIAFSRKSVATDTFRLCWEGFGKESKSEDLPVTNNRMRGQNGYGVWPVYLGSDIFPTVMDE